ncbi:DUF2156 domain-containing protein [Clostridium manihotivorum]|uniref:Phosphatidylglycerol lysyltransferase C-terminal domain-containing protein n=1 Tax=Clostridium manihotivorum TaxID=2320868 RepID=A0A410DS61_9CLOT|nr:phosphatidylglycerol lysyltransferase domain-containing protein [Clostridium manihotivorum]QAA31852.1 hypothetical protein C1I91_09435 [Clostridium manihotivorum]
MIQFKTLELSDKDIFEKYIKDYKFSTYEYSFLTLYLWKNLFKVEFGFFDEVLIIKKTESHTGTYFMEPIGYKEDNLKTVIDELVKIKQEDSNIKTLFRDIEESFLIKLKELYGEQITIEEDEDNYDYIYESEKLISLSGKKLHSKKNKYNQFIKTYDYEVKDIRDKSVIDDCIEFEAKWNLDKDNLDDQLMIEEQGIRSVLENLQALNAIGMAVYVQGEIAGFTIGEIVNKDMAIVHIEKGDVNYQGIYAFINKTFVEQYLSEINYVNREEDRGVAGLRKAKLAYQPVRLERKYIVNI